jgi:hypothetical protein
MPLYFSHKGRKKDKSGTLEERNPDASLTVLSLLMR